MNDMAVLLLAAIGSYANDASANFAITMQSSG